MTSRRSIWSWSISTRSSTVMRGADRDKIIENIDIGGPSMVRSAAKNHAYVAIVTDPADYDALLAELDANGGATSLDLRKRLAAKAYALTAAYDSTISQWFAFADQGERFPETWTRASPLKMPLRYGENPHQQAALYVPIGPHAPRHRPGEAGAGQGAQLQQSQRRRCRARAGRRVPRRRADGRHRQACQPMRRRQRGDAARRMERGARLRQRVGVRRHRRHQSAARRRDRRSDHADLHRSRGRARRRRGRQGDLRQEEESSAAADRRACPIRRGRARRSPSSPAASWSRTATMADHPRRAQM